MSNPYQTPPPGPYGGPGAQPQAPYSAPQQYQPQPQYQTPQQPYPPVQPVYQQPQPYQQPVQQPVYFVPVAPAPEQNQFAMAGVALGFVSIVAICIYGGFLGIVGLGVAIAGFNRSKATGVGRGMAIGGIVLNSLALLITATMVVAALIIGTSK